MMLSIDDVSIFEKNNKKERGCSLKKEEKEHA